jgi:hypothetical protein
MQRLIQSHSPLESSSESQFWWFVVKSRDPQLPPINSVIIVASKVEGQRRMDESR